MMTPSRRLLCALSVCIAMSCGVAQAASWMDSAANVASSLQQSNANSGGQNSTATNNNGTSLSSLAGLLNGGDKALSSGSMTNAAGVLQYCVKNNLLSAGSTSTVKDQLLDKLGINNNASTTASAAKTQDYQSGLAGILNTRQGNTVNLNALSTSQLTEKVKTKACDLVLKQSKNFIS
ncbi:hypothetical protein Sant_3819 [Sodalis praecaptivus]|uniref:DUF2501 domain-containing protein n=2 Tax=Bruguierivoracaceae TaxID=2812006 RepID=W0HY45_9GAMM|nr:hypothetical protein Sant_3819 [Sodalis praecaptivus]